MNTITNKSGCADIIELYRIDPVTGEWDKKVETNNNPSILQKLMCKLGLLNVAGDALTDYAINDLSTYLSTKYTYVSVGTDGTNGDIFSYSELLAPVMTRTAATVSITTTYSTNDTVQYTAIITSNGDYALKEAGLFTASTSGYMGARQTFYEWNVVNGEVFGMIWKIINTRG